MPDRPQIFLCYASEDLTVVQALYRSLTKAGFNVWMSAQRLLPGQNWESEIKKALNNSELIIVCLSSISIQKRSFVQKEIRQALNRMEEKLEGDIYLIPARLDDCPLPDSLSHIQAVDLFKQDGLHQLTRAIQTAAGQLAEAQKKAGAPAQSLKLSAAEASSEFALRITSPLDFAEVEARTVVEGYVADRHAEVWVVVRPIEVSGFWIQSPASVREDGSWRAQANIGRESMIDAGKRFEIIAVANPILKLREGMTFDDWPAAAEKSQVVEVTRRKAVSPYTSSEARGPQVQGAGNITFNGSVNDSSVVIKNTVRAPKGPRRGGQKPK